MKNNKLKTLLFPFIFLIPLALHAESNLTAEAEGNYVSVEVCGQCHGDRVQQIGHRKFGQEADPRTPFATHGCETCHGPGKAHVVSIETGEPEMSPRMTVFAGDNASPVDRQNETCLQCHKGGLHMNWPGSTHNSEDMACVSCHTIHSPGKVLERSTQAEVCYQCHKDIRAQTFRASSHPIREGKVVCSDCHNPHGSAGPSDLKQFSINENCYSCHAEKRGPFLWEHFPASEDCLSCHKVHGSSHPSLLTKQGPLLCQQCHQDIRSQGRTHIRRLDDAADPDANRARFTAGMNCVNCHSQVHGSNHPSGPYLQR